MEDIKVIFSKNLSTLRKKASLTQVELAEKLNYSDKAISKWERAEAIPDAYMLKQIASFFNVTIDFLLNEQNQEDINNITSQNDLSKKSLNNNHLMITFVSIIGIWLIALLIFIGIKPQQLNNSWWCFIIPIPTSALVAFIFSCIWANKKIKFTTLSVFCWTILLMFFFVFNYNWLIFLIGIPTQIIILLSFNIKKTK